MPAFLVSKDVNLPYVSDDWVYFLDPVNPYELGQVFKV